MLVAHVLRFRCVLKKNSGGQNFRGSPLRHLSTVVITTFYASCLINSVTLWDHQREDMAWLTSNLTWP